MGGEELKWRQLAHHQLMSQKVPYFSTHSKVKLIIKPQISGKLVTSGISDVVMTFSTLQENPSEEDDYDNYY